MQNYSYTYTTVALMKEWIRKYDREVISAFLKTIENKPVETLLFQAAFLQHLGWNEVLKTVEQETGRSKTELEIEFRYLLLDWTKYIQGETA